MNDNGNGQTDLIAGYIQLAEEAMQLAEQKRKTQIRNQLEVLVRAMQPVVEKLSAAGARIEEGEYGTRNDDKDVAFYQYRLVLPGFAPFWLAATPHGPDTAHVFYSSHDRGNAQHHVGVQTVPVQDEVGFGQFLIGRKAAWQEMEAKRLEKEEKAKLDRYASLLQQLKAKFTWGGFVVEPAKFDELLAELARLDPDADQAALRRHWQNEMELWREAEARKEQERREEAEKKVRYQEQIAAYEAAWAGYRAEQERVWAINRERFLPLQERWNRSFSIFELHYALVAREADEEGSEIYLEKAHVDCLGRFRTVNEVREIRNNGVVREYAYMATHVYKVSPARTVYPLEYKNSGKYPTLALTGDVPALVFPPGTDPSEVEADVKRTLELPPAEPAPGDLLHPADIHKIRRGLKVDEPDYTCDF